MTLPLGILGSARVASGGGVSPISIIEQRSTTFGATGPQSVTFSTTPVAGDRVLVLYGCHRASSIRAITSISGMGGSWAVLMAHVGQISAWLGTGVNAAGTVTITQTAPAAMTAHLYLIRGLTSNAITSANAALGAGSLEGPSVSAALGQAVFSWVCSFDATLANTVQFPGTQSPATGWTNDDDNQFAATMHFGSSYRLPTEQPGVTHASQSRIGSGDAGHIATLALGTAA